MKLHWIFLMPLSILASACGTLAPSGGYYEDDGPGANPPINVANLPDAVPKAEPLSASGNRPYVVYGKTYTPMSEATGYRERGIASWYGKKFHGRRTSSGEPYDMYAMTAAHKTLPLPSYVRVRNLQNGRSIVVRVNDRGPFLHNRLIDLSYAAAAKLGILGTGTGMVEIEALVPEGPATQVAKVKTFPLQIISPAVAAEPIAQAPNTESKPVTPPPAAVPAPGATPPADTRMYLQVGAFTQRDNAVSLRQRLEREALGPVTIQSGGVGEAGANGAALYRVRIGPLANIEEADRLTERAALIGISDARVVIE